MTALTTGIPLRNFFGFLWIYGWTLFMAAVALAIAAHICLTISVHIFRQIAPETASSLAGFLILRSWEAIKISALLVLAFILADRQRLRPQTANSILLRGLAIFPVIWAGIATGLAGETQLHQMALPAAMVFSLILWHQRVPSLPTLLIGLGLVYMSMVLHETSNTIIIDTLRGLTVPDGQVWSDGYSHILQIYTLIAHGLTLLWLVLQAALLAQLVPPTADSVSGVSKS